MVEFKADYDRTDPEVWYALARIDAYRQSVQQLPMPPRMAEHINRLVVARTVQGTVGVEGSSLTEEEARDIVAKKGDVVLPGREREVKEGAAAQRAHEYVRQRWGRDPDLPIREEDIRHIHRLLTEGIPYENNVPGQYRHHPAQVGSDRHGGVYRPPSDHEAIRQLMAEFIEWINSREMLQGEPGPVRAILAHYLFVLIHPFGDGNGRTARALESLILYKGRYNVKGFYSSSTFYYRNRDDYFTLLQLTRTEHRGDQTKFLKFALQGLHQELQFIEELVLGWVRIIMFQDYVHEKANNKKLNVRQGAILDYLSTRPEGIPWNSYRARTDPLIRGLYHRLTDKTLLRDVRRMLNGEFARTEKNEKEEIRIVANIDIMDKFI